MTPMPTTTDKATDRAAIAVPVRLSELDIPIIDILLRIPVLFPAVDPILWHIRFTNIGRENALKVSASCCAQVSYRKNDTSLEKAKSIFDRLVGMSPLHASPFEHVAQPYSETEYIDRIHNRDNLWYNLAAYHSPDLAKSLADQVMYTGNFRGWIQYRQLVDEWNG